LLVSAALLLLPVSVLLFARRAVPGRAANVLLGMPFVLGWAFAMGFLGFQLGLGLGVLTLAFGWEPAVGERGVAARGRHALASLAYLLCVWVHPVVALITGLAFLLLEGRAVLRWREWPRMLVVVGPAAVFLVGSYLTANAGGAAALAPAKTHFSDPVSVLGAAFEYDIGYSPFELLPRIAALALLLPAFARALRAHPPSRGGAEAAVGRLVLALLVLYCVMPGTLADWYYCSARFLAFAWLLLPVAAELSPRIRRRVLVIGPALTAVVLAVQWPVLHRASAEMQDVLDVGASLPRGARFVPMAFTLSVLGPQPTGAAWGELVLERDAVASQLFAAGRPRMGGERFRTLTFRPGMLDPERGALPWSGAEMSDAWRPCAAEGSPARWFVHFDGSCDDALAGRRQELGRVLDRYDYVLMLDPPPFGRDLLGPRLRLVRQSGSAWLYAVVHEGAAG
ncbi:MAG TPA: hypothetical protein VHS09_06900, partial [Polyangiaceae bacterium]|nr:hypothetical protein [Polyangiaceae bacterium]